MTSFIYRESRRYIITIIALHNIWFLLTKKRVKSKNIDHIQKEIRTIINAKLIYTSLQLFWRSSKTTSGTLIKTKFKLRARKFKNQCIEKIICILLTDNRQFDFVTFGYSMISISYLTKESPRVFHFKIPNLKTRSLARDDLNSVSNPFNILV